MSSRYCVMNATQNPIGCHSFPVGDEASRASKASTDHIQYLGKSIKPLGSQLQLFGDLAPGHNHEQVQSRIEICAHDLSNKFKLLNDIRRLNLHTIMRPMENRYIAASGRILDSRTRCVSF